MSKLETKQYQLWIWYGVQEVDHEQRGYELNQFDSPEKLFLAIARLQKEDQYVITQSIDLRVEVQ